MTPKRRLLTLIFACLCFKKSLLIKIMIMIIIIIIIIIAPLDFPRLLQDESLETISIGVSLIPGEFCFYRER